MPSVHNGGRVPMWNLMACWADTASSSPGLCFYGDLRVSFAPDYQIYCSLSIAFDWFIGILYLLFCSSYLHLFPFSFVIILRCSSLFVLYIFSSCSCCLFLFFRSCCWYLLSCTRRNFGLVYTPFFLRIAFWFCHPAVGVLLVFGFDVRRGWHTHECMNVFFYRHRHTIRDTGCVVGNRRNEGLHGEETRRLFTHGYGSTWMDLGGWSDVCFLLVLFSYFLMRNVYPG